MPKYFALQLRTYFSCPKDKVSATRQQVVRQNCGPKGLLIQIVTGGPYFRNPTDLLSPVFLSWYTTRQASPGPHPKVIQILLFYHWKFPVFLLAPDHFDRRGLEEDVPNRGKMKTKETVSSCVNKFFTITERILMRWLANFYCQQEYRRMKLVKLTQSAKGLSNFSAVHSWWGENCTTNLAVFDEEII